MYAYGSKSPNKPPLKIKQIKKIIKGLLIGERWVHSILIINKVNTTTVVVSPLVIW